MGVGWFSDNKVCQGLADNGRGLLFPAPLMVESTMAQATPGGRSRNYIRVRDVELGVVGPGCDVEITGESRVDV